MFTKTLQPPFCVLFAKGSFGFEGVGDHGDGHGALGFGESGNVACSPRSRTSTHTGRDDGELGVVGDASQHPFGFQRSGFTLGWVATCTSSSPSPFSTWNAKVAARPRMSA